MRSPLGLLHPLIPNKKVNRSSLASGLEKIRDFLQSDAAFLLADPARDDCLQRAIRLLDKARISGEVLYVGIVGGTGVGKSTLINALACKEISRPSDKRPYTDRAVVYRHKKTPRGLQAVADVIRDEDAIHESDAIKDLLLLDLPDFDSLDASNRRSCLRILPELDCIVWLVSPEKYADAAFYLLVAQTAIHQENFLFVLNKADELIWNDTHDAHFRIKGILGDLTFRLKHEAGIEQPRVFSISAAGELSGETGRDILDCEFQRFRDFLMVRREAKDIASVKTMNLIEESVRLLKELNTYIRPDDKKGVLNSIRGIQFEAESLERDSGLTWIEQEKEIERALFRILGPEDASIWPVRWAMRLLKRERSIGFQASGERLEAVFNSAADVLAKDRMGDLEKIAAQIGSELLLAFPLTDVAQHKNKPHKMVETAISQVSNQFCLEVEKRVQLARGPFAKWRRFWQKAVLFMPLPVMLMKLAGPDRVWGWLEYPTISGFSVIMLSVCTSLFSSEGLTGIAVLLVLQILLTYRLAARRIRRIEKVSRKVARSAITNLEVGLDSVACRIQEDGKSAMRNIQDGIDRLENLNRIFNSSLSGMPESQGSDEVR